MRTRPIARDERGATAIEYGVIAGAVALAALTAFWTIGGSIQGGLSEVAAAIGIDRQDEGPGAIIFRTSPKED